MSSQNSMNTFTEPTHVIKNEVDASEAQSSYTNHVA